jgi:2-polyprenyl-3-methyl-5-hydroxy-6-metoxy-1,4-benzoquinol methylase
MNITKFLTDIRLKIHYSHRKKYFNELFQKNDPYNTQKSEFEQFKLNSVINVIKDKRYENALEIGCAEGFLTNQLSTYCNNITGIDISDTAIEKAKKQIKKENVDFVCANIVDFKPDKPFDLIVALDVCYYLAQEHSWKHIEQELSKWTKWLSSNGRIVLLNCFNEISHSKDWLGKHIMQGYRKILESNGLSLAKETVENFKTENISRVYLISVLNKK